MWAWIKDFLASWWDLLVASDAGLIRLLFAARAASAVVLSFLVVDALSHLTPLPMAMVVMGTVESLFGTVAVRDPTPGEQRTTLLLTPIPAALAFTVSTVLAPSRAAGDAGFLVVIVAAAYARRFGPRAAALGMVAFFGYFAGILLHLPLAQVPYQFLALVIGAVAAFVVRFGILPDRPEPTLRRVLAAFYRRVGQILDEIDQAMAAGAWDEARRRRVRRRVTQLNETALAAEGEIEALDPDRLAPASQRSVLGSRLFDLEIIVGWLAREARLGLPPQAERSEIRRALDDARRALGATAARPRERADEQPRESDSPIAAALRDMREAVASMPGLERAAESLPAEPGDGAGPTAQDTKEAALLPTTRAAIQVGLASLLAIVAGEFLSPQRWYWAIITVFIMFTGTQSRGDVLIKGVQRAVGTIVGVAAGILVATAASGHSIVSLCLIFACVFLAFYFSQIAHGTMVFWITILISLLFGLLGYFSPALLVLRVEETAIGSAIGILVAMFVLPTRSRDIFTRAAQSFLRVLGEFVGRAAQPDGAGLTEAAREVNRCFHQARVAATPLTSGLAGAFAPNSAHRWLRIFLACDYYARSLAAHVPRERLDASEAEKSQRLAARIRGNIDRMLDVLSGKRARLVLSRMADPGGAVVSRRPARTGEAGRAHVFIRALAGIDGAVWLLTRNLGGSKEPMA
ncbi:MAG: FUSC family protein [Acetobacteraceae bacterium]|nr:FUSC family protein [Acetobacteraceae bacterium]